MLTLPIKQEWFDMICHGEKREEYREATEYYQTRINSAIAADPNCKGQAFEKIKRPADTEANGDATD